jgi:hypothetical protein
VQYTPEELGAVVDEDGNPVDVQPGPVVEMPQVRDEPAEQVDWVARARHMQTSQGVRDLWAKAKHEGTDEGTLDQIAAIGTDLKAREAEGGEQA